jgi:hypothetical protein
VLNNQLSLTDPTGYFFSGLFKAIGNFFKSAFRAIGSAFKAVLKSTIGRAVIQIAVCALDPIAACAAVAAGLTAAAGGSVVDAIKAAAFSLVQFGVWTEVGFFVREVGIAGNILAKGALHGVVGGALAVAQGGSFLHGFASNAIGAATGIVSGYANNEILDTALVATTGGFAAMITGGKFANGAITAAFANLYNKWQATFTQWGTLGGFGAGAVLGAGAASGTCISATAGGCLAASPYVAAQGAAVGGVYGGVVGGWLGSTVGGWIDGIVDIVYSTAEQPAVVAVDSKGNAIPLNEGEYLEGSKDGKWIQVKDKDGATGVRIDGGHPPSPVHQDPRAQPPHAHIPGRTNPDGTPWLPVRQ